MSADDVGWQTRPAEAGSALACSFPPTPRENCIWKGNMTADTSYYIGVDV